MDAIEEFGLLLKALTRESDRRINDLLRPLGITASQAEALQLLDRYGPLSLGELGTLLIAEGGHPSRLVDRMVTSGLLRRESADNDRRRVEISCTARGSELARQARERKETFRSWVRDQLSGQDLTAATALLECCLRDTQLAETVRSRREHALAEETSDAPATRPNVRDVRARRSASVSPVG
ncbi:MarR family winged helix-turn-helix transcriptional regulator [Streptomyces sp. NPDC058464]|uniref:MarR family winged helix-turn-helix transcriptional regulator n=1 Tax=Streptomyces sp. NPDC058464 TaxID=3346511 RepID=UPI0036562932